MAAGIEQLLAPVWCVVSGAGAVQLGHPVHVLEKPLPGWLLVTKLLVLWKLG